VQDLWEYMQDLRHTDIQGSLLAYLLLFCLELWCEDLRGTSKLLGDSAAVTAMLDRLLHHGHILKCGPRSWRTKTDLPDQEKMG
jgi:IstB-like ATP binding protein